MEKRLVTADIDKCFRRIGCGWHIGKGLPDNRLDVKALFKQLKTNGVQSITFYIRDMNTGDFSHPIYAAFVREARKSGIIPVLIVSTSLDKGNQTVKAHPEWAVRLKDRFAPINAHERYLCIHSPYREYLKNQLRRAIEGHDIGGIMFDEIHYGYCRCAFCVRAYRKHSGGDIPDINFDDLKFRRYVRWCFERQGEFLRDMRRFIKSLKNDIPVSNICYVMGSEWTDSHPLWQLPELLDYFSVDIAEYLLCSMTSRLFRSLSPGRAEIWDITSCSAMGDMYFGAIGARTADSAAHPLPHALADAMTVVANGLAHSYDVYWKNEKDATFQEDHMRTIRAVNREIQLREPWMTDAVAMSDVALSYSTFSHVYYGRLRQPQQPLPEREDRVGGDGGYGMDYYNEYTGTYKALLTSQVAFDTLIDERFTDEYLGKYKVLVLGSNVCLSQDQCAAVERFVRKGGGLVATYKTSLWDEFGTPRKDFGLARLLGVHYQEEGRPDYDFLWKGRFPPENFYVTKDATYALFKKSVVELGEEFSAGKTCCLYTIPYLRIKNAKAQNIVAYDKLGHTPLVTVCQVGRGKVIYIGFRIGTLYHFHGHPQARRLLAAAVRAVHPQNRLPVEVSGPMKCEVTVFKQEKLDRLLIHITNFQDLLLSGYGHAVVAPAREQIPPLVDVTVSVRRSDRKPPQRVYLAPEKKDLHFMLKQNALVINVPRINAHGIVVVEG